MLIVWIIGLTVLISLPKIFDQSLWLATRWSAVTLMSLAAMIHLYVMMFIRQISLAENYELASRVEIYKKSTSILQKSTLIGLAVAIIGLFLLKDTILIGAGIAILFLFGIEFLTSSFFLWTLEETLRRNTQ